MKIFEKDERIHLQLIDLKNNRILFDFSVEKDAFEELRHHMIHHLNDYKLEE